MRRLAPLPPLDASELSKHHPWKQPWWRPAQGDGLTFAWIVAIHVGAALGLILAPIPSRRILLAALVVNFLGGLGLTVAYHRAIAHKSLRLHPAVLGPLTFLAMFNGSGAPLSWAANHRLHHAKADTPEDISSPGVGGFWWSHLRWLWQAGPAPVKRYCKDMDTAWYRFWTRAQIPILALSLFGGLFFGWTAFFWLGPIRLTFALHAQCLTNSVCHLRREANQAGTAMNVPWVALMHFFHGENWHQNHHDRPGSARLGWTPAQVDVGWYTIVLLEKLRLATDVRRPSLERATDAAA
jgi:fatty-acid desaturase